MLADLDYWCGMALALIAACLAVACGAAALNGWGTVLFITPDLWQSVAIHSQPDMGFRAALGFEVYACPALSWLFGWIAMSVFKGR